MFDLVIGILGMLLVLVAFVLEDLGKMHRGGLVFNLLNLIGAVFLIVYAYANDSYVFIALNAFWATFAIYFLVRNR